MTQNTEFCYSTAIKNLRLLIAHTNSCLKTIFEKYNSESNNIPLRTICRSQTLIRALIVYELCSIFAPDEIQIDPYLLLHTGLVFFSYINAKGISYGGLRHFAKYSLADLGRGLLKKSKGMEVVGKVHYKLAYRFNNTCTYSSSDI